MGISWTELGIALAGFFITAGGVLVYIKLLQSAVKDLKDDVISIQKDLRRVETDHGHRLSNHDVIFESLSVNQGYMIQGIDEIKGDLKELKDEHRARVCTGDGNA